MPRILLVDDDPHVREDFGEALLDAGYDVTVASEPEEAWAIAEGDTAGFDLLMTDVVLAGINGLELAERWTERFSDSTVLFVTGYAEGFVRDAYRRSGAALLDRFTVLEKPFDIDTLKARVAELVASVRDLD